jgi:hypothetical protein
MSTETVRVWPDRVYVDSDNGSPDAQVYDAATGKPMEHVFEIDVHISRRDTYVDVTASAHEPFLITLNLPPEDAEKYQDHDGVVVDTRRYHLRKFQGESY